jgi:hypothetical protein
VDFSDLVTVAANFGLSDGSGTWNMGDFNFDGNVGFVDLVTVAANFGAALPAAIPWASADFNEALATRVPEPAALTLLAALLMINRVRRR